MTTSLETLINPLASHMQTWLPWRRTIGSLRSSSCLGRKPPRALDWKKHKLESRFPGEISITLDMQMTPPLWQKAKN